MRLLRFLSANPKLIPFYFKNCVFNNKLPVELGLPWISYSAIKFLNDYAINNKHEILELGGGGSTIFFGQKGAKVTCLESSELWAKKIIQKCDDFKLSNVDLKIFPYNFSNRESFIQSEFFNFLDQQKYDIILIDNYEEEVQLRPYCFYKAEKSINPGGIIILDDSWRYPEPRKNNSAKKHIVFQSIGPCRLGVTSTDIYFY